MLAINQSWRFVRLVTALCLARGWGWLLQPLLLARQWLTPAPKRLMIAPQDIRTADPTLAEDIYAGHFAFNGQMVNTQGASPFAIDAPDPGWLRILAGFGWLRHLRAANTALARANARGLVQDFISAGGKGKAQANEPRVLARRILSWLSQSPIILENADRAFYQRFMKSLGRAQARLQRQYSSTLHDDSKLSAAIALAAYHVCAQTSPSGQRKAIQQLANELSRQILPDGGHISRNPRLTVDLLLDLLPLRQAFAARSILAPPQLLNSIDRMMPMLRMFRHGDGTLALFNGMGATAPDAVATVLAYDDIHAKPLTNARQSGYQRLEAGPSLLLADTGAPPPPAFSGEAHAGCLSFEFSSSDQRILVNCGAPGPQRSEARAVARVSGAHTTLVVADTSSAHVANSAGLEGFAAGQVIAGPNRVSVSHGHDATGNWIEAGHDGYVVRFGLVHIRRLTLSADGGRLTGQDRLLRTVKPREESARPFALRFHLHPNVSCQLGANALSVRLKLASGEIWQFEAGDKPLTLEESIFFAAAHGARPCQQIVLQGMAGAETLVNWSLLRLPPGL